MADALEIHEFAGARGAMANEMNPDILGNFSLSQSPGWDPTRISGLVAMLIYYFPEITFEEIAAFAMANGWPDWEINTDPSDTTLIASDGSVIFVNGKELSRSNFPEIWTTTFPAWQRGELQVGLPEVPAANFPVGITQPAETSIQTAAVVTSEPAIIPANFTPGVPNMQAQSEGIPFWVWLVGGIGIYYLITKK